MPLNYTPIIAAIAAQTDPLEAEIADLQSQITGAIAEIADLEAEIVVLEATIAELEAEQPPPSALPTVSVSDAPEIPEAGGPAVFTVTLSAASDRVIKVNYVTSNGSATSGTDYTAVSGMLTFQPGETSKPVNVPVLNDTAVESPESFSLGLNNATLALEITDATGAGSITSEDVEPPPPPPPPTFVWPNASNTGVPAGTTLTNYTGPSTISAANTVVDSKTITQGITVTTSGVTFRKCRFTSNGSWIINGDTATNMTIEDCEFNGGDGAILAQGTFTRLNIHNCRIGITLKGGKSTIKNCFIHTLTSGQSAPHFDGVFIAAGQRDCLIEDCLMQIPSAGGTASIFIATRWAGANNNIVNTTVNHCRLLGTPSYAMYSEQTSINTITGTRWTNNEVQRGAAGYWAITNNTVFRQGNKDAFSGANIDSF